MTTLDRFLRYVSYETTSDPHVGEETYPSAARERVLLSLLREELAALGLAATMDPYGYVTATLPASAGQEGAPVLGLIAHVDTSPAVSGKDVRPTRLHYTGGDIPLADGVHFIRLADCPALAKLVGEELIVTDGRTLLGADDKAGVAEIVSAMAYLVAHPEIPHGAIRVAFTPDEEIGRGTDYFDVPAFGATYAYTVDGGALGEIEYENFHAAAGHLEIQGISVHPGSAKGIMKNAVAMFAHFHALLPPDETPERTEGYEGFYMVEEVQGDVEHLTADYIIRDHDRARFEERKAHFLALAEQADAAFGGGCIRATVTDSYYNMAAIIQQHPCLIEKAQAAMRACGVEPITQPIRGGTDGARLSYAGLPCPNLSTGGYQFHSRQEFIPVRSLETMTQVLVALCRSFAL